MKTVLLVEDEPDILENHRKFFAEEGFRVLLAATCAQAREHLSRETPGAIVLDIMLPDGNGLDLLTELREAGSKIPVIMLTAWGKSGDVARGLRLGANDYMSKPFTYEVLKARVDAMLRNVEQIPEIVTRGALTLSIMSDEAFLNGENLLLTQKEFSLLVLFVENEGMTMSAEYIYEKVWGQPLVGDARALRKIVHVLRKKLDGCGWVITTEYGGGYRFERG
jgi:DNA-binding response OmpR family regulator